MEHRICSDEAKSLVLGIRRLWRRWRLPRLLVFGQLQWAMCLRSKRDWVRAGSEIQAAIERLRVEAINHWKQYDHSSPEAMEILVLLSMVLSYPEMLSNQFYLCQKHLKNRFQYKNPPKRKRRKRIWKGLSIWIRCRNNYMTFIWITKVQSFEKVKPTRSASIPHRHRRS